MRSRDPQRVLTTIRRTTAGSLLVAAVGSGVVAVHLAGDHASAAAATRANDNQAAQDEQVPQPEPQAQPRSDDQPAAPRHHSTRQRTPAPAPSQGFQHVAPVQPGTGSAQSGSGGS